MSTSSTEAQRRVQRWAGIGGATAFFSCVLFFSTVPFEMRMRADAERRPTGWNLYLKNVPGTSVSYRASPGGSFLPAEREPNGYYDKLTVEALPSDDLGVMPVEIEYTTWVGLHRRTTFAFDMTAWQAGRAWSNVYSSGGSCWVSREVPNGSGWRTVRIGMASNACVRWRYGLTADHVETLLPVGATTFTVPESTGSVYVRQHICDGQRTWLQRLDTDGNCEDENLARSADPMAVGK